MRRVRRRLALVLATVALAGLTAALLRRAEPDPRSPAAHDVAGAAASPLRPRGGEVAEARYRLSYEQYTVVPGREPVTVLAQGAWITTPTGDGHTAVRFVPEAIDGPGGTMPGEADVQAAFELAAADGTLTMIGFADETPAPARRLLTGLATTFQLTARPGAAWTAIEEDLTGHYQARYRRDGATIVRERSRYTALRDGDDLATRAVGGVTPRERSRFVVDADGVVSAEIELDVRFELQPGAPAIELQLRARLDRAEVARVPASGLGLALAAIDGHADLDGARRDIDQRLVAGATAGELIGELQAMLAASTAASPERGRLLARLAAAVRLDPAAAGVIATRVAASADPVEVRVLAGALASTEVAAGTDALAGLVDRALPAASRTQVMATLSLADPVTPTSVAALRGALDDADGAQALFGLATHQRKIASRDPALAAAVVDDLLDRAARATAADQRLVVAALGNAGTVRALPVLQQALASDDRALASAAAFSLRFVPGDEADALIERALTRPEVAYAAVRAIGYRAPDRWRATLAALRDRFVDNARVHGEIEAILHRWG